MSAIAKDSKVTRSPGALFSILASASLSGRCSPAWLAAFLILLASPLSAQTFEPSLTVGGGIQTSYQHIEPMDATADRSILARPRPPLFQRRHHEKYQRHVQHGLQQRHQQHGDTGRGGAIPHYRPSSTSGSAAFFRRATAPTSRPVLRQRVGGIIRMASRTAIPLSFKVATTASRIGATSKRV